MAHAALSVLGHAVAVAVVLAATGAHAQDILVGVLLPGAAGETAAGDISTEDLEQSRTAMELAASEISASSVYLRKHRAYALCHSP